MQGRWASGYIAAFTLPFLSPPSLVILLLLNYLSTLTCTRQTELSCMYRFAEHQWHAFEFLVLLLSILLTNGCREVLCADCTGTVKLLKPNSFCSISLASPALSFKLQLCLHACRTLLNPFKSP